MHIKLAELGICLLASGYRATVSTGPGSHHPSTDGVGGKPDSIYGRVGSRSSFWTSYSSVLMDAVAHCPLRQYHPLGSMSRSPSGSSKKRKKEKTRAVSRPAGVVRENSVHGAIRVPVNKLLEQLMQGLAWAWGEERDNFRNSRKGVTASCLYSCRIITLSHFFVLPQKKRSENGKFLSFSTRCLTQIGRISGFLSYDQVSCNVTQCNYLKCPEPKTFRREGYSSNTSPRK